uniref:Flap endonuclease 1 n=1 Tax=Calcidiscus leptoporus TaxID=127549 RepID=A0A7S0NX75_9EUKA|mmetsp:Transcript_32039/g.74677  ORF Transcript_32039/g.74677 Transcript_32039/m.74677 type:complete len:401 (+) Transcript_32039:63-1265(+)
MGIKGLMPFLSDSAPSCVKETKMEAMTGRVIAIDASMCLYQFLVAVRQGASQSNLANEAGEVTSHIQGFLSRTVRLLECGIRPVYVFDGKPPELKRETLREREERKQEADGELAAAMESGDADAIKKASHRTVRATPQMNADVQELLRLLGVPVVLAPCEAEASCAALCKAGKVYATATEDMDALTFGTPKMLKNLFDTESSRTAQKRPVFELTLSRVLEQLDVSMATFIDFCILCGCDYCGTIRGIGPATAFKLLKLHGSLEAAVATIDANKLPPEEQWQISEARALFSSPPQVDPSQVDLKWTSPDVAGLKSFLIDRHSFNEGRVTKVVERLSACRAAGSQSRLESFFTAKAPKTLPASEKFNPFAKRAAGSPATKRAREIGGGSNTGKAKVQRKQLS